MNLNRFIVSGEKWYRYDAFGNALGELLFSPQIIHYYVGSKSLKPKP
jgi:hypothetical protein